MTAFLPRDIMAFPEFGALKAVMGERDAGYVILQLWCALTYACIPSCCPGRLETEQADAFRSKLSMVGLADGFELLEQGHAIRKTDYGWFSSLFCAFNPAAHLADGVFEDFRHAELCFVAGMNYAHQSIDATERGVATDTFEGFSEQERHDSILLIRQVDILIFKPVNHDGRKSIHRSRAARALTAFNPIIAKLALEVVRKYPKWLWHLVLKRAWYFKNTKTLPEMPVDKIKLPTTPDEFLISFDLMVSILTPPEGWDAYRSRPTA